LRKALSTLSGYLCGDPVNVQLQLEPIDPHALDEIAKIDHEDSIQELAIEVLEMLVDRYGHGRSVMLCGGDSPAARLNPLEGRWGIRNGCIAFVFAKFHEQIVWHEALHTLGAEDCYDESNPEQNPGPTCELSNCVMQYHPTAAGVGEWPLLCKRNVTVVRESQ